MRFTVEHHHYFHGTTDDVQSRLLNLILKNQQKMNQDLEQIKSDLTAANDKVAKVKADVTLLHTKVDAIADQPTAEEWAEVKTLSGKLNTSLQEVDDQTPEETTL